MAMNKAKKISVSLILLFSLLNPSLAHATGEGKSLDSKNKSTIKESSKNPKVELPKINEKPTKAKPPILNPPSTNNKTTTPSTASPLPTQTLNPSKVNPEDEKKYLSSALASKLKNRFSSLVKNKNMNVGQSQAVIYAFLTSLEAKSQLNLLNQITNYDSNKYFKNEQLLSLVEQLEGDYSKSNILKQGRELNLTQKQLQILKLCNDLNTAEKQLVVNETLTQLLANGTITDQLKTQLTLTFFALLV